MPPSALLVLAAVTDRLVNFATNVVGDLGLPGIFLLMVPESACIPIPSEATMLFAGFNVSKGVYSLEAAVLVATFANLVGSLIAYAVGYFGRVEVMAHSRFVHLKPEHIETADRWFERWGSWAVFFGRMLPVVRTFISLPAGVARMPLWRFSLLTFLGALPWNFGLALIGKSAGDNWEDWQSRLHYLDYVVLAVIVVGAAYLGLRWRRARRARVATDAAV